ncbi:MAG: trans-sulfuration enzyme family protein [Eubacterium sp.]|jgi:methionine-gamma-lyase
MKDYSGRIATAVVHGAHAENSHGALATPIYQTSTFVFSSAEQGGRRFSGQEDGFIYTRLGNPTTRQLEKNVALLEHGDDCVAFSSGMGAISGTLLTLLSGGDLIVADKSLYGCTFSLICETFPRFGIKHELIDMTDENAYKAAIVPETKVVYFETVANPSMKVADIEKIAEYAHKTSPGCFVVVDNTFASPLLVNPLDLGADVVVHSATKYLNGHGDVIAGFAVARQEIIDKIRTVGLKDITGSVLGPQEAYLILRGIKTMKVRMEAICGGAMKVAEFLHDSPYVDKVYYPGLSDDPYHETASKEMDRYGGMISFEMHDFDSATKTLDALKLCKVAVSLGDCETLIEHPASMTHSMCTKEEIEAAGFSDRLIRLSIGLEDPDDIIDDLKQAFETAAAAQ